MVLIRVPPRGKKACIIKTFLTSDLNLGRQESEGRALGLQEQVYVLISDKTSLCDLRESFCPCVSYFLHATGGNEFSLSQVI